MRLFRRCIPRQTALVLLGLSCLLTALPQQTFSQGAVTLTLRPPPPNTLRLSDLWEVTILGFGQPLPNVHLSVTVTDASTQAIALTATTSAFTLSGGTTVFTGRGGSLPPTTVKYQSASFRDAIARTGNAPSGTYTVDISLLPSNPAAGPLGTDQIQVTVQLVSPPLLLTPVDGAEVSEKFPVFAWTMTGPAAAGAARSTVEYAIRIVEIIGRQSPTAAMQANPAWFERANLTTPTLLYPPSARPFTLKARYAWKVNAVQSGGRAAANAGRDALLAESEVWEFTAVLPTLAADDNVKPLVPKKKAIDVLDELLRSCSSAGPGPVK